MPFRPGTNHWPFWLAGCWMAIAVQLNTHKALFLLGNCPGHGDHGKIQPCVNHPVSSALNSCYYCTKKQSKSRQHVNKSPYCDESLIVDPDDNIFKAALKPNRRTYLVLRRGGMQFHQSGNEDDVKPKENGYNQIDRWNAM